MRILDESLKLDSKMPTDALRMVLLMPNHSFHLFITTTKYKHVIISYAIHNSPISLIKLVLLASFKAQFSIFIPSFFILIFVVFHIVIVIYVVVPLHLSYLVFVFAIWFAIFFRFGLNYMTWINHPDIELHPFFYPSSVHDNNSYLISFIPPDGQCIAYEVSLTRLTPARSAMFILSSQHTFRTRDGIGRGRRREKDVLSCRSILDSSWSCCFTATGTSGRPSTSTPYTSDLGTLGCLQISTSS